MIAMTDMAKIPLSKPPQALDRQQLLEERLQKSIKERRKLAGMESSTTETVQQYAKRKGGFVARSIGRLQQLLKEDETPV